MVNFRFHLVSLAAVFLALAAGITIGAGVVDRATVDRIQGQLDRVEANRRRTNEENDRLKTDLARWGRFSAESGTRLVSGRLPGTGVLLLGVRGLDRAVVEGLTATLSGAGARLEGTVWFTRKWELAGDEDARQLAALLDVAAGTAPDELRSAAVARLAGAWGAGPGGAFVTALRDAAFVEFEPPAAPVAPLAELPTAGSLVVLVSSDSAELRPEQLAHPLSAAMAGAGSRLLVAQPVRPALAGRPPAPPPLDLVTGLRADSDVAARISTVDNIDDFRGRVAAVLALEKMGQGRTGHYGFGADAQRLVPEEAP